MTTLRGYLEYTGGCSVHWRYIMIHAGGYHDSMMYWTSPNVFMISPFPIYWTSLPPPPPPPPCTEHTLYRVMMLLIFENLCLVKFFFCILSRKLKPGPLVSQKTHETLNQSFSSELQSKQRHNFEFFCQSTGSCMSRDFISHSLVTSLWCHLIEQSHCLVTDLYNGMVLYKCVVETVDRDFWF